ncbi:NmrA-like family protein [Colletotrichum orchidophilum]|uniref:NmrA-like family protein n=1 Tax=Colletotrichum orchidophilum TaxID=1209926 RepID=A0A1G4AU03_9PEZI|nr:NmrA-like family protein [Colletotrichum orchidophilum]OHE92647.1 NmrA-like family protein [Colletotrichum orchidophilum]
MVTLMPSQLNGIGIPIRPAKPQQQHQQQDHSNHHYHGDSAVYSAVRTHKHSRSSYSDASPLSSSRNNSLTFRPFKRSMPTPNKTIAVINASGRQAASFIRVATAVGYHVRAQLRNLEGVVATEVNSNPNVTVLVGELYTRHKPTPDNRDVTTNGPISGVGVNHDLINDLFRGAQLAFINTTFYGDEFQIGKALADAAKKAGVQHYVYSTMPDHAAYKSGWPSLPLWAAKHQVEEYVRSIGMPATFVYTGIYNNNFTSLPYPLFCMELQQDGSFVWQAPFHEDVKLPWLDAEHDVGPAIIQIFKDGLAKWRTKRVALAWEMLTPREACEVFARGVGRPVRYVRGPIELKVKIPNGYRQQLEALEKLFSLGHQDPKKQPPYFGDVELEDNCLSQSMALWEGPRGLEEYAQEAFPLEEQANGLTWMLEEEEEAPEEEAAPATHLKDQEVQQEEEEQEEEEYEYSDEEDEGLTMRGLKRDEEEWLA